jgi:hypothetical protein
MKTSPLSSSRIFSVLACSLFLLGGCKDKTTAAPPEASQPSNPVPASTLSSSASDTWQSTKDSAQVAAKTVGDAVSDAWEKSKDATFAQRKAVSERMKAAETSLDMRIREWTAKKDAVVDEARPAVSAAYKEVGEAREVLSQKIDALDNATEETWNSVKSELDTAWQRMTAASADLAAKIRS